MSHLNVTCAELLREVEEAVSVAVVDLTTGRTLAHALHEPRCPSSYLQATVAAAVEMYRGKTITRIEQLLTEQRRSEVHHTVREIQLTTDGSYHFLSTLPGKPQTLALLVTSRQAGRGLGLLALRNALPRLAALCN